MTNKKKRCGFVSITGLPNAGKSTLINNLINEKISIISHKVQTTQSAIRGIMTRLDSQIIFTDTPGIIPKGSYFKKNIARAIFNNSFESHINLLLMDPDRKISLKEKKVIENLLKSSKINFLVINKIDKICSSDLLKISKELNKEYIFDETFMISALKKKGFKMLIDLIIKNLPQNPWIYKKNEKTDQKDEFTYSEITREKIFQLCNKEIPYDISVVTKINNNVISQLILVKKKSQKPILIGKNGSKIKEIGIRARRDMQRKLKKKIFLDIKVKVSK